MIEPGRLEDVFLELYEGEAADEAEHDAMTGRGAAVAHGNRGQRR